jgi:superfamily I DNA/RNA helicase
VIIPSDIPSLDGSLRSQAWAFIEKLRKDDTAPGLHIEPMKQAADRRARTGRVNGDLRAVLIKLTGSDAETRYIYLGTFQHDAAIAYARSVVFQRNAQTSVAEVIRVDHAGAVAAMVPDEPGVVTKTGVPVAPALQAHGITFEDLIDLGIAPQSAHEAIVASDPDRLLEVAIAAPSAFQTDAILWLADGKALKAVRDAYRVSPVVGGTEHDTDDDLISALDHPASRMEFTYLEHNEDLRAAIEDGTFARWRVFLHPEQREHAEAATKGAFRLSGGAGTGKTVVLLHRARHLHGRDPEARIVLATYNKTLAVALKANLLLLDKGVRLARKPGEPGIHVGTVDAVSWHLVSKAADHGLDVPGAAAGLFGQVRGGLVPATDRDLWDRALRRTGEVLPEAVRNANFFAAEYGAVVVSRRITTRDAYLLARRQGRGVSLGRAQRNAVWDVIEAYRDLATAVGTTDYDEKAMLAAIALDEAAAAGGRRVADHVLVDEAQDLTPARLILLRALSHPGPDDLFLAEDSQQRIYVPRTVLSRHGIRVTGRSRRLRLNYRTTAQNLDYASSILAGQDLVDLEDGTVDDTGLRSARSGPPPELASRDTLDEAYDAAVRTVRGWLAEGASPETIAVLVRTGNDAMALHQRLVRDGLPTQKVGSKDTPGTDRVIVMTMHRSKGMEFRNVLVFGAPAGSTRQLDRLHDGDRPDALQRERSLLYVATTRARDRLTIVWHGAPSELLPQRQPRPAVTMPTWAVQLTPEEERAALAREVHDTVGHSLAQIALQASVLEVESDSPAVREFTARIRAAARQAGADLQNVLTTLRTGADGLRDVSFDDLTALLNDLKDQGARITSTVVVSDGHTADRTLTRTCYRIVQESVTNALRHARGLPVDITLRGAPDTGVTIVVHNPLPDGVAGRPRAHSGIIGMMERARSLGGALSARPAAGRFVVDARLPWNLV